MTDAGRAAFARRTEANSGIYSFEGDAPRAAARALRGGAGGRPGGEADFDARPPYYRRAVVHWVTSAKREATRERRLAQLMESSARRRGGASAQAQVTPVPIGQETPVPPSPQ